MSSWKTNYNHNNFHSHINSHKLVQTKNLSNLSNLSKLPKLPKFIKSYVINLKINPERLKSIDQQLKRVKIKYQRFEAIYGKDLDLNQLSENQTLAPGVKDAWINRRGTLGCYLSHVEVWKKILDDPDCQVGLIFEDDAVVRPNIISSIYDSLRDVPPDWDLLYLGSYKLRGKTIKNKFIKPVVGNIKGHNSGMFGYLINKRSIPKLLSILLPVQTHTKDPWVRINFDKINAYFLINKSVTVSRAFKPMRTSIK